MSLVTTVADADLSITTDLGREYAEKGYVLVKGLLTKEEAAYYRQAAHDLLAGLGRDHNAMWPSAMSMAAEGELRDLHDAHFYSGAFARLLVDERITGAMAAVLGTPNVQLHHNKLFVKPQGNGAPFPLHQDYPFFPHDLHRVGAAIVHFDDAPIAKGCLRLIPGSHHDGPREHIDGGGFYLPDQDLPGVVPIEAEAGDVLLFTYLTVHGSGVNTSSEARTTWLIQYRDPVDRPSLPVHQWSLGQGMMLRGVDPTGRR